MNGKRKKCTEPPALPSVGALYTAALDAGSRCDKKLRVQLHEFLRWKRKQKKEGRNVQLVRRLAFFGPSLGVMAKIGAKPWTPATSSGEFVIGIFVFPHKSHL